MTTLSASPTLASRSGPTGWSERVGSPRRDHLVLVLELLGMLPTRPPGALLDDLIDELGVKRRAFYRLLSYCRAAGIGIEAKLLADGRRAGYYLGDRGKQQMLLLKLGMVSPQEEAERTARERRAAEATATAARSEALRWRIAALREGAARLRAEAAASASDEVALEIAEAQRANLIAHIKEAGAALRETKRQLQALRRACEHRAALLSDADARVQQAVDLEAALPAAARDAFGHSRIAQ